jgi:hypothetical protein
MIVMKLAVTPTAYDQQHHSTPLAYYQAACQR